MRDAWTKGALDRVWRSVLLLQPPFPEEPAPKSNRQAGAIDPGFGVIINGVTRASVEEEWSIESKFLDHAIATISGQIDADGIATFNVSANSPDISDSHTSDERLLAVGEANFEARYFIFDSKAMPGAAVRTASEMGRRFGGIRVYRNGFRVMPYGEPNDDWLQLAYDTSRRNILVPANNFNFFGQVKLDIDRNPLLEEIASREGLSENEAFDELVDFVRSGLEWGAKRVAAHRERKQESGQRDFTSQPRPSVQLGKVIADFSGQSDESNSEHEEINSNTIHDDAPSSIVDKLERVRDVQSQFEAEYDAKIEKSARYEEMLRILASLGMSIAVFGHEVRGALSIVGAEIERLKAQATRKSNVEFDFSQTETAVGRLFDLGRYITELMSHAESRQLVNVPLHSTISKFVRQFETYLNAQGISFEVSVEPDFLRTTLMHRSEIDSVLFNFITNAVKAIMRTNVDHRMIRISVVQADGLAVLSFQDNGSGIDDDIRDNIFEPFFTTSEYSADDVAGPGSGLGLKIVSDIAAVYGGSVRLGDPEPGFNTRFDFAVPVAENQL